MEYTTAEAAQKLNVQPSRVRQLASAGLIAGVKRGRDWFITAESIAAYRPQKRGRKRVVNPVRRRAYHDAEPIPRHIV